MFSFQKITLMLFIQFHQVCIKFMDFIFWENVHMVHILHVLGMDDWTHWDPVIHYVIMFHDDTILVQGSDNGLMLDAANGWWSPKGHYKS